MTVAAAISTLGGLGRLRGAPGTVASLVAVIAAWGLAAFGGRGLVLFAGLVASAVGGWASEHYERERGVNDPPDCVIDEVAGQFVACAFAPRTLAAYAVTFLLFRVLDILKPWPIRLVERLPGGLGIVADDVLAGVLSGLAIIALTLTGVFSASAHG